MANYTMHIQKRFLDSIRSGIKKHEYRLCSKERESIKDGDILILIDNQNSTNFLQVKVKSTEIFKTFEESAINDWDKDFKGITNSYKETVELLNSFYLDEDIKKNGVIKIEIELI